MRDLIEGGYLALWGVALFLVWVATLRLLNIAQVAASERGWCKPPEPMLPMQSWSDPAVAFVALLCGVAGLIAFLVAATHAVALPHWMQPLSLPPGIEMFRICASMSVLTFFVTCVAEHPAFKVKWIIAWTCFAMFLAWLT